MLLRADASARIDRTIASLPERFRVLLVLREFEDVSYRELAGVLEIPVGSVMSGLSRARQALRVRFTIDVAQPFRAAGGR